MMIFWEKKLCFPNGPKFCGWIIEQLLPVLWQFENSSENSAWQKLICAWCFCCFLSWAVTFWAQSLLPEGGSCTGKQGARTALNRLISQWPSTQLYDRMEKLKLLFDMMKPHTLGPVSQLWTFVSLKGWTWRPSSCSFFFSSPACSLKIPFLCYCFKACFSQHTSSLHTSLSTHIIGIYIFSSVDFSMAKAHFQFSVHWYCTLVICPQTK